MARIVEDEEETAVVGNNHHSSSQRFLPHHIKIMKVALATAIIRQKPDGVSARQYTERLALQFSQLQLDWRERARQLQQELLRTRQELTTFQLRAETHTDTDTSRGGSLLQGSDSEWQSSGYSSSISQERTLREVEEQARGDKRGVCKTERITAHIKFLSNVSSVLSARQNLSVLTEADLRATVRDTIVQATRGLSEVLMASSLPSLPPSLTSLQTATEIIVEVLQAPRMQLFRAEMEQACSSLLKSITTRISSHHDPKAQSEVLCSLVAVLCSVPALLCQAVQQLTSALLDCAHMLSSSGQDVALLDVGAVQTAASVFNALEVLCAKYDTSCLPQQMCARLCSELESSISDISGTYPLFSFSVWRLLAHLS